MTAAGTASVLVDSVTSCNLEPMGELELLVDCCLCLHAMVVVKIKLGWLTATSSRPKSAQTVNMHDLHLQHDKQLHSCCQC